MTSCPSQVRYNLPIEVLYTIAPVIVVAVLFFFTVEKQNKILEDVDNPDHNVLVTAQQWSWTFSYIGEDADGDAGCLGVRQRGRRCRSCGWSRDESVEFILHSPDVIHDFWVPSFYFKQDVIPGRDEQVLDDPDGRGHVRRAVRRALRRAALPDALHGEVVDQAAYDAHMQELLDAGQIGAPLGGENSEQIAGLEEEDHAESRRTRRSGEQQ